MDLFLIISLNPDPLYFPYKLQKFWEDQLEGIKLFQVDTHASSELITTAREAIRQSERIVIYIDEQENYSETGKLTGIFKAIVLKTSPVLWMDKGNSPFNLFRRMFKGEYFMVNHEEEAVSVVKSFYRQQE